jgi:hypothetical protein
MSKYEQISIFQLMQGWKRGGNPSQVMINGDTINHFNGELVGKPTSKEHMFGFATDSDEKLQTFAKYRTLLEGISSDTFRNPISYRADVSTLDITRRYKSELDSIQRAYDLGGMSEEQYLSFVQAINKTEYPDYEQYNTSWSLGVLLDNNIYGFEQAYHLSTPLPYRNINDRANTWDVKEATIGLNGFLIHTHFFQDYKHANSPESSVELSTAKVTVEMPYVWEEEGGTSKGAGNIRIEFLLDKKTIQVFFDKHISGGRPLMTGEYSIATSNTVPQELRDDEWSAFFMRSLGSEGVGKPIDFEFMEDFLDELIEVASEYAVFFLKLAFELLLTKP